MTPEEAEIARLRDLLRPFAALADRCDQLYTQPVPDTVALGFLWDSQAAKVASVGDCRKARAALREPLAGVEAREDD